MILRPKARFPWVKLSLIPFIMIGIGTLGYMLFERLSLFEALYLSVISITTVGYGDIYPMTVPGRLFTMAYVLLGVFLIFFVATTVISAIVSGELAVALGEKRMSQRLDQMKDHMIICGFGRMGRLVAQDFEEQKIPFVVIDENAESLSRFHFSHGIALQGDCSTDDVLIMAGVTRARGLVSVVSTDADNLFITMSARLLNEKLFIVSRAESEASELKLLRVGANRAISPYRIGGARMAQALLRPTVVDFIELATKTSHLELQMEETRINEGSPLIGLDLRKSNLREELGVIIVAIKKPSGKMIFNPPSDTVIEAGDILIVLGDQSKLITLFKRTSGRA